MKCSINNISLIRNADITLNNISVIAGENDSGKSTVGKILYCFIKSLLQSELSLTELLNEEFDNQINNISKTTKGSVEIYNSAQKIISAQFEQNKIIDIQHYNNIDIKNIFFINSPFIIDDLNRLLKNESNNKNLFNQMQTDLFYKLLNKNNNLNSTQSSQDVIELINEVCSGEIVINNCIHYKINNKVIPVNMLAAGLKVFAILKVLLTNNWFGDKCIFILDEPEIHLHPEWQLLWAEVLILLSKAFPVHILINTHSPYFLRAIQIYSLKHDSSNNINYYMSNKNSEFESTITDATNDLVNVYASLSKPFEDLQEILNIYD